MGDYTIYRIYNIKTKKCYVGVTSDRKKRKRCHFDALKGDYHHSVHLQRSYNKHGHKAFRFETLQTGLSKTIAFQKEIGWIDFYDSYRTVLR